MIRCGWQFPQVFPSVTPPSSPPGVTRPSRPVPPGIAAGPPSESRALMLEDWRADAREEIEDER